MIVQQPWGQTDAFVKILTSAGTTGLMGANTTVDLLHNGILVTCMNVHA